MRFPSPLFKNISCRLLRCGLLWFIPGMFIKGLERFVEHVSKVLTVKLYSLFYKISPALIYTFGQDISKNIHIRFKILEPSSILVCRSWTVLWGLSLGSSGKVSFVSVAMVSVSFFNSQNGKLSIKIFEQYQSCCNKVDTFMLLMPCYSLLFHTY